MRNMPTMQPLSVTQDTVSPYLVKTLTDAASRVRLALGVCQVTKELYGYAVPVLDEQATLRRVALFVHGSGKVALKTPEMDLVLPIIRGRFDEKYN